MFIVDRLLPIGLNLLCGSSKIGKSWLALYLAISVAKDNTFLGFNTNKSSVLYYALEDTKNRLYERGRYYLMEVTFHLIYMDLQMQLIYLERLRVLLYLCSFIYK